MRFVSDLGLWLIGLAAALLCVSFARLGGGAWGMVQVPVIVLTLAVFFLKEKHLAALAIGLGIGLDLASAYPFFVWTAIVAATAFAGWWLSKTVLTNRSLPSLILLGAGMRLAYFIFELVFSRTAQVFGGSVWYMVTSINFLNVLLAFGIELVALVVAFMVYVRSRGEHSRMLTHL
jgi:hypothetical protein